VDQRAVAIAVERMMWLLAVVAALLLLGTGLAKNVYFENTPEALRQAAVGVRMIWAAAAVLVGLTAYARWRAAPRWSWMLVLSAPVGCGGLMALWSGSLVPQLVFLVVGPLAGLAALVGAVVRWRPGTPERSGLRPAR
jgi:multisubunit Na+/H+ antiporter MnhB subunit